MTLDPRSVGLTVAHDPVSWDETDTMLYALTIGAGSEALGRTTENSEGAPLRAYPWMPVVHCQPPAAVWEGIGEFDWRGLVHAEQALELHEEFPVAGRASAETTVVDLYDKGTSAIVVTRTELALDDGRPLATGRGLTYIRGAGGWGGHRGPSVAPSVVEGAPDAVGVVPTDPRQPLLYRINGDRNPLHSDPAFARAAGFDRPIMHGLCTFGMALRTLLDLVDPEEERSVRSVRTRFASPMYPGEPLTTVVHGRDDEVHFTSRAGTTTVLAGGTVVFA